MAVKAFQPNEHKEEIKQLFRDGVTLEEMLKRYPPSMKRSIYRYQKEVTNEQNGIVPPNKKVATTATAVPPDKPVPLAVITSKSPAPIVFRMGDLNIDLDPAKLYRAYLYCEDIRQMEPSIDDDFTTLIKVAVQRMWDDVNALQASRRSIAIAVEIEEEG